jgi:hypothetical protein
MLYQIDGCHGTVRWQSKAYKTLANLNRYIKYRDKISGPGDYWVICGCTGDPRSYDPKVWSVIERSRPNAKAWFEYIY